MSNCRPADRREVRRPFECAPIGWQVRRQTDEKGDTMSKIRVLVSGASIAGPALAHWLHRRGAEVSVVERGPGVRPGGEAGDARGGAGEVIRRMGLDPAVRTARTDTAGAHNVDVDGNVLETFRADDDGGDGYIS